MVLLSFYMFVLLNAEVKQYLHVKVSQ